MKFNVFLQIGHLPKGLNPPSSNMLYFNGPFLAVAIKTGIVTGILSLTVSHVTNAFVLTRSIKSYAFLTISIDLLLV